MRLLSGLLAIFFAALATQASATVLSPSDSEQVVARGEMIRERGLNAGYFKYNNNAYFCSFDVIGSGPTRELVVTCIGS